MNETKASLVAKTAFVAALFAVALSFLFAGVFDPLGNRRDDALDVSRQTVALVICSVAHEAELRGEVAKTDEEREAAERAVRRYNELTVSLLRYRCEGEVPVPAIGGNR